MDATSKPGAKKRKTWHWARATGSAGRNQQRRGGRRRGSFGGRWERREWVRGGEGTDSAERKRLNPDHRMAGGVIFATGDAEPSGSEETWVLVLALTLVCCVTLGETLPSLSLIPHLKK